MIDLKLDTEAYCENCDAFTPLCIEPLKEPLPTDSPNKGHLVGDLFCGVCYWVHTTIRHKAQVTVDK